jgi:hypothetical protein
MQSYQAYEGSWPVVRGWRLGNMTRILGFRPCPPYQVFSLAPLVLACHRDLRRFCPEPSPCTIVLYHAFHCSFEARPIGSLCCMSFTKTGFGLLVKNGG